MPKLLKRFQWSEKKLQLLFLMKKTVQKQLKSQVKLLKLTLKTAQVKLKLTVNIILFRILLLLEKVVKAQAIRQRVNKVEELKSGTVEKFVLKIFLDLFCFI